MSDWEQVMKLSEQMIEFANAPVGPISAANREEAIEIVDSIWASVVLMEWVPQAIQLEDECVKKDKRVKALHKLARWRQNKIQGAYEKLAKTLGKTAQELTEQEKVQARTNAVLEAGVRSPWNL